MPAKGKRVAARQAQLNRRRRRQVRAGSDGEVQTVVGEGGLAAANVETPAVATAAAAAAVSGTPQGNPQPARGPARSPAPVSGPGRNAQPMAYTHLAGELRRILILAGIITAVLIGLSFVV